MAYIIFGRRGEDRLGQYSVFAQAFGQFDSVNFAGLLVLPPAPR